MTQHFVSRRLRAIFIVLGCCLLAFAARVAGPWAGVPEPSKRATGRMDADGADVSRADVVQAGDDMEAIVGVVAAIGGSKAAAVPPRDAARGSPRPLDVEWDSIPISRSGVDDLLTVGILKGFRSISFLRNVHLNPRDTYIAPGVRSELDIVLESIAQRVRSFREARQKVNRTEFHAAIERGSAQVLSIPIKKEVVTKADGRPYNRTTVTVRDLERQGVDMVSHRDGVTYGAAKKDMPLSRELLEQEHFLRLEIGGGLVRWFRQVGCLNEVEHHVMLEQLQSKWR